MIRLNKLYNLLKQQFTKQDYTFNEYLHYTGAIGICLIILFYMQLI